MSSTTPPSLTCTLRQCRVTAGLSQSDLAGRVGVSRQALIAIEAGRQVPSTTLALHLSSVLGCRVEDLFRLAGAERVGATLASTNPTNPMRVILARVDERWVAHPVSDLERPGDGVVVGIQSEPNQVNVQPFARLSEAECNVLVAGCAPLLGVLTGRLARQHRDARAMWISANSTHAVDLLSRGLVHVAGLHLVGDAQDDHTPLVRTHFPNQDMTIVNLTRWRQGLCVAKGNPLAIRTVNDLLRRDVRVVRRDVGSGAEQLLQRWLSKSGEGDLPSSGPAASSHTELAQLVRFDLADVGVCIEAVAIAQGLDFVPLDEERFDLIVPTARLEQRPIARLFDLVSARAFQTEASALPGYDLSISGHASSVHPKPS